MEIKNGSGIKAGVIVIVLIAIFFIIRFGFTGVQTILAIILLYIIPSYALLSRFDLDSNERLIFSIFLGIGLISTLVYFLGLIIRFSSAIIIVAVLLIILILITRVRRK